MMNQCQYLKYFFKKSPFPPSANFFVCIFFYLTFSICLVYLTINLFLALFVLYFSIIFIHSTTTKKKVKNRNGKANFHYIGRNVCMYVYNGLPYTRCFFLKLVRILNLHINECWVDVKVISVYN